MDMLSILSVIVKANGMDLSVRDGQTVGKDCQTITRDCRNYCYGLSIVALLIVNIFVLSNF